MSNRGERPVTAGFLIARIAGLPASWLDPFGSRICVRALRSLDAVEQELAQARAHLGDRLYALAASVSSRQRRFLLAIKRDCHNGRSLVRHRTALEWEELTVRAGPAMDRVLVLEEQAQARAEDFVRAFASQLERETLHSRSLAGHQGFQRGLALSSRSLVENLRRLEAIPFAAYGRKEWRACQSLLRYASRAALKLSPYSTLTRIALGRRRETETVPALRLLGHPGNWHEESLVRVRKYLIDQLSAVLLQCPALRDVLPIRLNPSVAEIAPDRYRLLRPAGWGLPDEERPARYIHSVPCEIPVSHAIVEWLRERLSEGASLSELRVALGKVLGADGGPERAQVLLVRLVRLGLLVYAPPWSADDPRLEERLLDCLHGLSSSVELTAVGEVLARIILLEKGFSESAEPLEVVREIERLLDEARCAAASAAGLPFHTRSRRESAVHEDVLLLGSGSNALPDELLEAHGSSLREILHCVEPWFRLIDLYAPRYELQLTFTALARRHWPGQNEIGALELFQVVLPFWREIQTLIAAPPLPGREARPTNLLDLPEVEELGRLRRAIWSELPGLLQDHGEVSHISSGELRALLELLPPHFAPVVGPCVFLQPVDPAGELWVLNRIFEGTGRYASRFTPVLPESLRHRFTEHLTACSELRRGEEDVELIDLLPGQGDTLNVHAVQTRRVLALPGEPLSLPPGRRVDPTELRVKLDGPCPSLIDTTGRPLLPVYLGGAVLAQTPPLITFLALFGPGELRPIPVPRHSRHEGDVKIVNRVVLDRVVLARQRWIVPTSSVRGFFDLPPARTFAALDRWRRDRGIPERVFAIERVFFEGVTAEVYKPQYLDFTSPSFCCLFEAVLRTSGPSLVLEEVLPASDAFPSDSQGERWAVEIQVDSLAMGRSEACDDFCRQE